MFRMCFSARYLYDLYVAYNYYHSDDEESLSDARFIGKLGNKVK